MKQTQYKQIYAGNGQTISQRNSEVPLCDLNKSHSTTYIADNGLRDAVNVAISLSRPLLVTGEPGTGKTELAFSVARELELPQPFIFLTKTTSMAKDLFYEYDTLQHFQDARISNEKLNKQNYVQYQALGLAILQSMTIEDISDYPENIRKQLISQHISDKPSRALVLIDEIDKAPRDFPNDILHEIDKMAFTVRETGLKHQASRAYQPIVIITSNSEKNLPDTFLRRCIYYHIEFPGKIRLKRIVEKHLGALPFIDCALDHFFSIRKEKALKKPPAIAECLDWLSILGSMLDHDNALDFRQLKESQIDAILTSYSILFKSKADLDRIKAPLLGQKEHCLAQKRH
jgi:MoxR-like ATPase